MGKTNWLRQSLNRLDVRVVIFLSIALLPLGVISVFQTALVSQATARQSRLSLQLLTEQAAYRERRVIEGAFGAARALSTTIPDLLTDAEGCQDRFQRFLRATEDYTFAGFLGADGMVKCSSSPGVYDFRDSETVQRILSERIRSVEIIADPQVSEVPVVNIREPVYENDQFLGFLTISLPHSAIEDTEVSPSGGRALELITFNANGDVLTAQLGSENVQNRIPANRDLSAFIGAPPTAFTDVDGLGRERVFAVVPVIANAVYALGRWEGDSEVAGLGNRYWSGAIFPVVMWLTSLIVAYIAMHRMVIRHVRLLQAKMRAFALHRELRDDGDDSDMPTELTDMNRTLSRMTEIVLRDEADLENTLHERDVLLKEVHHRVKNNLQLISSIMNMQMRKVREPETHAVLQRLQDRVLGLAMVHRNLYQTSELSRVEADVLIRDIANQIIGVGRAGIEHLDLQMELDNQMTLYPDQAVPLSLMASEAITNAVKYLGTPEHGSPWLSVTLLRQEDGQLLFEVANSQGSPTVAEDGNEVGSGLGSRLIEAFARQLGSSVEIEATDKIFRLWVKFPVREFDFAAAVGPADTRT
ncbi:sensor histidine kinase [Qingshengfaniella alkalisoli]|uniref:histidine kinase n=1 Tax=Qingshengfaniella alkalisoli TaxID=2599296 RepID=A0A5B8J5P6_9RHOB|nr:sensor histidine kinase [Qingshengfaniella alkalisoli]QDY69650.1 sensor histidine kinase [Qingshengfaniella alkalisoli]